jgi:hypothetical protein
VISLLAPETDFSRGVEAIARHFKAHSPSR